MNLRLLYFTANICLAIYIPAVKLADGTLDVASHDANIQKQLREAVQNKTWPVNPLSKPRGTSQLEWSQSILNEFGPDLTYVWSPPILWETFLACLQFERHKKSTPITEPYINEKDEFWADRDGILQGLLIDEFGWMVSGKSSREEAMLAIERDFLGFLGATQSFTDDPLWYTDKVRDLLSRIKTAFKEFHTSCYRAKKRSLCDLWTALSEDIDRLENGHKLMLELMAELEHEAVIKDEYLIVRVTNGYQFYKGDDPKVPRALDWSRKFPGQRPPQVYEVAHKDYFENLDDLKLAPESSEENLTDRRRAKFSYGYTLLGGGWQEAWMPSGACCLAYAACKNDANPITYAVRLPADEIAELKLFMILPKFPLQLAYFGHGEFFHPRLGATHDDKMLGQYQTYGKMTEEMKQEMENPLLSKESLELLGIDSDDYVAAFNASHNLINRYLAERSRIISINHRLITDEKDGEALRILKYQEKLADINELERKVRLYEDICKTAIFTPDMDSKAYPKAVAARIAAINKKLDEYDPVFEEFAQHLEDQKTPAELCVHGTLSSQVSQVLRHLILSKTCEPAETEGASICAKAKIDCEGLGINPIIMYLMKGNVPYRLRGGEGLVDAQGIRKLIDSYLKFRALVDAGTFTISQLG